MFGPRWSLSGELPKKREGSAPRFTDLETPLVLLKNSSSSSTPAACAATGARPERLDPVPPIPLFPFPDEEPVRLLPAAGLGPDADIGAALPCGFNP
jgi:hypothetical protein